MVWNAIRSKTSEGEVFLFAGDLTTEGLVATVSALSRRGAAIYIQGAMSMSRDARRRVRAAAKGMVLFDDA